MKKVFLTLAMATGFSIAAQAQSETDSESIKASDGKFSLEANVGITDGNVNLSNALNQIKGRYFINDNLAFRLGFNVSRTSSDFISGNNNEVERTAFTFSVNPGIEKHFAGTNRLSPYIGMELSAGYRSLNEKIKDEDGFLVRKVNGGWGTDRGYLNLGINAIAGMDFYVARHLFIGYELGFGVEVRKDSDVNVADYTGDSKVVINSEGKANFQAGPRILNGVRVGFVF